MDRNGVSLGSIGNSDMDELKVFVANTTPIPVSIESIEKISKSLEEILEFIPSKSLNDSQSINLNPQPNDFQNMKGNLSIIVPSGFLLIHNDLLELKNSLSGAAAKGISVDSKGGDGLLAGASSFMKGGGLKGLAIAGGLGLGAGIVDGIASELSGEGKAERHLASIISELNMDLTADDFRDDQEVRAAQKESFVSFLKTYYTQQSLSMATEGVLGSIGTGAADAVVNLFKGTFGKLLGMEDSNPVREKLDSIVVAVTEQMSAEDYVGDDDILDTQKDFVRAYLWTYYSTQIAGMTVENVTSSLGSAIGGFIGGTIGTLLESVGLKEKQPEGLEKILLALEEKINIQSLSDDDEVKDAQKEQLIKYLRTYYTLQTAQMTASEAGSSVFDYLEGVIDGAKNFISGVFSGIFGNKKEEDSLTLSEKYNQIISILDQNVDVEKFTKDPKVIETQYDAMRMFIRSYYSIQSVGDTISNAVGKAGDTVGTYVGSIFKGIFDSVKGEENLGIYEDVINDLNKNITVSNILDADKEGSIYKAQTAGAVNYISSYYEIQSQELINGKDSKDSFLGKISSNIRDNVVGWYSGLFGSNKQTGYQQTISNIIESPDLVTLSNDALSKIEEIKTSSVITSVQGILEKESQALIKNYESSISSRDIKKSPLGSFSSSYISAVSDTLKNVSKIDFDNEELPIDQQSYDDTQLLNSLNIIVDKLNQLIKTFETNIIGNVLVNNNTVVNDTEF